MKKFVLKIKDKIESSIAWFYVSEFVKNWMWPAYKWRRLCHRMDIVKLPQIKATEWCDCTERMFLANMELVKEFVEYEKPETHVEWYGEYGHKYGEDPAFPPLLPEYDGMYVMDLIKKIYTFYTKELHELESDQSYLLDFCCRYLFGKFDYKPTCNDELCELVIDKSTIVKDIHFFDGDSSVKWDVLDRYLDGDRENLVKSEFLPKKLRGLEKEIDKKKQKMLHLAIELRMYLWT